MTPTSRTDMSNKKMLRILLQEIADVRFELKQDIAGLQSDMSTLKSDVSGLKSDVSTLKSDLKGLRLQVHQNHTSFITNQQDMERRLAVVEAA